MAVDTKLGAYRQTAVTALSTELNSLATATNSAASAALDNGTNLDVYIDAELVLATQGVARSNPAVVLLYAVYALDGTNYGDVNQDCSDFLGQFSLDAAVTARRVALQGGPAPLKPGLFKLFVRNTTGQALAATGNTVRYRTFSVSTG